MSAFVPVPNKHNLYWGRLSQLGRRHMNWDALGAIGEIFGAAAVLITLLYLAAQVRQANVKATFETTREIMAQFNDLNRLYATDSSIRQVLLKEGDLSIEEEEQLYTYADMYCNAWTTAQFAFNQGQIDETVYTAVADDVHVALERWPSMRKKVEHWLHNYPRFRTYKIFHEFN